MRAASPRRSSLHSLCTYLGSFPPELPAEYINRYTSSGQRVLDPFCGSGTTILTARQHGREGVGIDRNPLAFCVSSAKAASVEQVAVLRRVASLDEEFHRCGGHQYEMPADLRSFFHPYTVGQLAYIRSVLQQEDTVDNFILAALLGILHGKRRKSFGSAYLSVDMPNTFSMSPRYVATYVRENKLSLRPYDVFLQLRRRVETLEFISGAPGTVHFGDASRVETYSGIPPVDLIFTSPPYLGVLKYGAFNWLRLWLLGVDPKAVDGALAQTGSLTRYLTFLLNALEAMASASRIGTKAILVIGAVMTRSGTLLGDEVVESVVPLSQWTYLETVNDRAHSDLKTTRIWDETRGRASAFDQLIVLERRA